MPSTQRIVEQSQLRRILGMQNALRRYKKELSQLKQETMSSLLADVPVEPGVHYAELKTSARDGKRIMRLAIR